MKKAAIILAIITASIALNFAQTPDGAQPKAAPVDIPLTTAVVQVSAPVAAEVAAETAAEDVSLSDEAVAEEERVTDEIAMMDEVGEDAMINEGRISLRLKDAELKDVVRMFSTLSDANIIVPDLGDEEIKQKIDVNLDNVEWQPALEAILDTHGLELYEKIPGTKVYAIRKKLPGAPEALDVQVFKLNYASVNSVTNIVADLVGAIGSFSVFPERNIVVVQGTPKALLGIDIIMKQIDLPRQQVFIEAKFLELTDKAQRDLGVNWEVLQAYGVQATGLGMNYTNLDVRARSDSRFADIEGRPYESLTEEPVGGVIEWSARPGNDPENVRVLNMTPTLANVDELTVTKALTAVLGADDFRLILSALEQKDGVDLVSNPKIIVANEQEAIIHLGQKEPNIRIERTSGTTDNPGGSISVGLDEDLPYFEDGVKVVVKPTVNTSSNITIRITPELTSFVGRKSVQSDGTSVEYPISLTKKVDTMFSLESGQTAAIGGLTQTKESKKENKIPLLGDIPVLGRFFSYKQTILDQNETIIFVTVGLANPSSIDMETGLPSRTKLAQRYMIRENADLRIAKEEANLLQTKENISMKKELSDLREANQKLRDKQEAKEAKEMPTDEPAPVPEEEPVVSPEDSELMGRESLSERAAPQSVSAEEEISPVQEIIKALEPIEESSGGGVYDVKVPEPKK